MSFPTIADFTATQVHHKFNFVVGWSSEFAHPVESVIGNFIPFCTGPVLQGISFPVWLIWVRAFR